MNGAVNVGASPQTSSAEQGQAGDMQDGSTSLLRSLETNLEDLKTLVTCRVCIRLLYEPYTISCGHTFCYSCLRQWFDREPTHKTCPDCRSEVIQIPAPAYLVRDIAQIFITRAELLPADETTEDHRKLQKEEADLIEKDKNRVNNSNDNGIFRGHFVDLPRGNARAIRDVEDGVYRCPHCAWELGDELEYCISCGYSVEDSDLEFERRQLQGDQTESSESEHMDDEEEFMSEDGYNDRDIDESISSMIPAEVELGQEDISQRRMSEARDSEAVASRVSPAPPHLHSEMATDDELGGTDNYSAEDDEAGSLQDFVVDDLEEASYTQHTPESSRYGTDEVTDIIDNFRSYETHEGSDSGEEIGDILERDLLENLSSAVDRGDDSDEGPIIRSRRDTNRRPIVPSGSSSDGNPVDGASGHPYNLFRRRDGRQDSRRPSMIRSSLTDGGVSGNDSESSPFYDRLRKVPIDYGSDSDSQPPVRPARRVRGIANRIISDDDDDFPSVNIDSDSPPSHHSSTGTATMEQQPLHQTSGTVQTHQSPGETFSGEPPIVITSSPTRRERSSCGWSSPHESPASSPINTGASHPSIAMISNNINDNAPLARARRLHGYQARSPRLYNRRYPSSQAAPQSQSSRARRNASHVEDPESYHETGYDRAMRSAERHAKKEQFRRRDRECTSIGSGSYQPPLELESDTYSMNSGLPYPQGCRIGRIEI